VDFYPLTLAVLLLLGGAPGDRLERRALFRAGLGWAWLAWLRAPY